MQIYDCHVHSTYSFDAKSSIGELCEQAQKRGLCAIAVTDHNLPVPNGYAHYENILKSVEAANRKKEEYAGKLLVLSGVELGDPLTDPLYRYEPFFELAGLDVVLGSVHSSEIIRMYFRDNPYGTSLSTAAKMADMDFLNRFTTRYFTELRRIAEETDVDVITHLTFPLRYINGQENRGLDISAFDEAIDTVLCAVIKHQKVLEVNTSGFLKWGAFMPDKKILTRYFNMGGRLISLGSDAHHANHLASGFSEATAMLKELGFTRGSYFVNRKRQDYFL